MNKEDFEKTGRDWKETPAFPDPLSRFANEALSRFANEGTTHRKSTHLEK